MIPTLNKLDGDKTRLFTIPVYSSVSKYSMTNFNLGSSLCLEEVNYVCLANLVTKFSELITMNVVYCTSKTSGIIRFYCIDKNLCQQLVASLYNTYQITIQDISSTSVHTTLWLSSFIHINIWYFIIL